MPRSTEPSLSKIRDKAVRKYLESHAEPEAACVFAPLDRKTPYAASLVVPAYGEVESLLRMLESVPPCGAGRVLIIAVVNEPADAPDWARTANRDALERLREHYLRGPEAREVAAHIWAGANGLHDLVMIDRTGPTPLPARQGVGLARKIGADFALALFASGASRSAWIHCSDADARLPRDYFDRTQGNHGAALLYDFLHDDHDLADLHDLQDLQDTAGHARAILEYEIYLRYCVLGLWSAGSPYAFHTIGSTLALDARAYAQVRGFPRREAAEDFHLLAKLAKVGEIRPLRGEPIRLSGRASRRVPFGTGHAMLRAAERMQSNAPLPAPDPRNYRWLAAWLEALQVFAREPERPLAHAIEAAARERKLDAGPLTRALHRLGAIESANELARRPGDLARALNENFDALATLRLLHALRDEVHPDVPLSQAIARAPFLEQAAADLSWGDLEAVRDALIKLERRRIR